MRKTETAIQRCKTMSTLQKILGGKWKLEILYYIAFNDIHRFGELRRQLGEITESSLTKQLRELEADGFLIRHDFKEIPPRVEYTLSEALRKILCKRFSTKSRLVQWKQCRKWAEALPHLWSRWGAVCAPEA